MRSGRKPGQDLKTARGKLARKNERLRKLQERLGKKDRELAALRAKLAQAQSVEREPGLPSGETPVFFIVGRAKSGTSWLMRILDAHPEILCKGEGRFFGHDFIQEDFERGQKGRIQPSSLYRALLEAEYLEAWIERSVWTRGDDAEEHLINLTRLSTDYFLTQRLSKSGKRIVGDKTPFLDPAVLEEISKIHPNAKVIHVIRDGRDVAVSSVHHKWNHAKDKGGIYELEPEEMAKRDAYREDPEKLLEAGESIFTETVLRNVAKSWNNFVSEAVQDGPTLFGDDYTQVRYEGLLQRPEEEVGRLLQFLGAEDSEETVERCVSSASFENWTEGRKRGQEDSTAFLRKGVAGDWRNVFTKRDKQIFQEVAGDLLIELGYEENDEW